MLAQCEALRKCFRREFLTAEVLNVFEKESDSVLLQEIANCIVMDSSEKSKVAISTRYFKESDIVARCAIKNAVDRFGNNEMKALILSDVGK